MAPCHSFTHKASPSWKVIGFWVTNFLSLCLLIPPILRNLKCSRFIIRWFALGRDFPDSGSVYDTPDSGGECGVAYESYFQMPTPAADKPWYSIESGPVHFTVMSTEHNWAAGSEQASWRKVFTWDRFVPSKFINVATTSFEIIWPLTLVILQYNWIQSDLASVNRSSTPWLIFAGYVVLLETTPMSFFQKLCSQFEEQQIQQQFVLELLELVEIPYRGSMEACVGTLPALFIDLFDHDKRSRTPRTFFPSYPPAIWYKCCQGIRCGVACINNSFDQRFKKMLVLVNMQASACILIIPEQYHRRHYRHSCRHLIPSCNWAFASQCQGNAPLPSWHWFHDPCFSFNPAFELHPHLQATGTPGKITPVLSSDLCAEKHNQNFQAWLLV